MQDKTPSINSPWKKEHKGKEEEEYSCWKDQFASRINEWFISQINWLSPEMNADKTATETAAEQTGSSEERKSTPYQRIVIACPDNHIIVVKRFTNGGKRLAWLRVNEISTFPYYKVLQYNTKSKICVLPT